MTIQQITIDLSVKQTPPDLLEEFLNRPVFQLTFFRLTDEQTPRRQIGKRLQTQFIRMHHLPHIVQRNDLAFRVRNGRRELRKTKPFPDDSPDHPRFDQKRRGISPA